MVNGKASYLVKCPSCGASNRVPEEMAGKSGKCGECHGNLPALYVEPIELGDSTFREFLQGYAGPVLADFWAVWCSHCRNLATVIRQVAAEMAGRGAVVQVNIDVSRGLASSYQISGIPTMLVIKGGQVVERISGERRKETLVDLMLRHA
jgi:thioredoxin 2